MLDKLPEARTLDTSPYVEFGDHYLSFREDTPYEVWSEVVHRLKGAEKSIQWWIGDALRFGERKYGEMYSQALEETDYSYGTLRNAAYVAGQVEMSRRHDNLSFKHHQEVAALEPVEQDAILSEAAPAPGEAKPRMSSRQVREKARELRVLPQPQEPKTEREVEDVEDPNQIEKIVRAATMEYIVQYADGSRYTVTRNVLLDGGFAKCACCGGLWDRETPPQERLGE